SRACVMRLGTVFGVGTGSCRTGRLAMRPGILLIPFAVSSLVAGAQPSDDQAHAGQTQVSHTVERHCPLLAAPAPGHPAQRHVAAERLVACEETSTLRGETPLSVTTTLKTPKNAYCAATYSVEYTQKDAKVGVAGMIENKDCAASSGEYKIQVRVRDETGEV